MQPVRTQNYVQEKNYIFNAALPISRRNAFEASNYDEFFRPFQPFICIKLSKYQ